SWAGWSVPTARLLILPLVVAAAFGVLRLLTTSPSCSRELAECPPQLTGDGMLGGVCVLVPTVLVVLAAFRLPFAALITMVLGVLSSILWVGLLWSGAWHVPMWAPVVLLVVLSGPATDFHVFLLHLFRGESLAGMSPHNTAAWVVRSCANTIGGSVAVAFGSCLAFGFASTGDFREL